jgi:tetratricopeptide (TPR) repeat protein
MPIPNHRSTRHPRDLDNDHHVGNKVDMACNLNITAWLLVGTMAISTVLNPQVTVAYTIEPGQNQTSVGIKPLDAITHYQQGLAAMSAGNLTEAMNSFNRSIELDRGYFPAYIERGNIKDASSDLPGAIADYTIAITLNPQAAPAFYNRGTVLSKSGKHQAAIADYNQAIHINPEYAQAYMNLGNELDDLGDVPGALASYNQAIKIKPDYALAYLNRGIMYGRGGNRALAIADFNQAANLFKAAGNLDRANRALKMIRDIQSEV